MNSTLYAYKIVNTHKMLVQLQGDWSVHQGIPKIQAIEDACKENSVAQIDFLSDDLGTWDSSLIVFINKLKNFAKEKNIELLTAALPHGLQTLIDLIDQKQKTTEKPQTKEVTWLEALGQIISLKVLSNITEFVGMIALAFSRLFEGKSSMQTRDLLISLRNCGPSSLPIISLTSLLIGMILAYVGLIQLKQFGAEVYIASLVSIGMSREMAPMMVAVIMSGKIGATYAAELGTMQVNEEIDALKTMGISIYDYLVLPRILGLVLIIPIMNLYATFLGLLGGSFIALGEDVGLQQYWQYAADVVVYKDFVVGTIKSIVFAMIIAACGCYQGINSGRNSAAVGQVTTKAVVSSIVIMIVADACLTIIYNILGV